MSTISNSKQDIHFLPRNETSTLMPSQPLPLRQHTSSSTSLPPAKRVRLEPSKPSVQLYIAKKDTVTLPEDLGKLIEKDVALMQRLGWTGFVQAKQGRKDLGSLEFNHPVTRILKQHKKHGVPVKLSTPAWTEDKIKAKLH